MNLDFLLYYLSITIIITHGAINAFTHTNNFITFAANKFSAKFYELAAENVSENIIVSPISTLLTLTDAMKDNSQEVLEDFRNALNLTNIDDVFDKYRVLKDKVSNLPYTDQNQLSNSLTRGGPSNTVNAISFLDIFDNEHVTDSPRRNNNVRRDLSRQRMMFSNNIDINDRWQEKFSTYSTSRKAFYSENTIYITDMMSTESYFSFGRVPNVRASCLKLRFQDGRYSMLIVLPDDRNHLRNVERKLAQLSLREITRDNRMTHVELDLPKFSISYQTDPKNILKMLGFNHVFSDNIQSNNNKTVNINVLSNSQMNINEGTVDDNDYYSFVPVTLSNGVRFNVNHPFHFKIIKTINETEEMVMFVGHVTKV
ncbi:serpin B5-like isoform X2 [Leptopilina heterotoma]|uniref:serpin B5-like isoform X2 n=1 Tax=Leptopilina heterotoma TaxID=63436 RepID=UPI001CAA33F7|nr:serpin B5-like isoform X2 [Leptopilina heterotoma]